MRSAFRTAVAVCACLLLLETAANAAVPTINVGAILLSPNTANQQRTFDVSGGDMVASIDLYVQIGDGTGNLPQVPKITSVDLSSPGLIFAGGTESGTGHAPFNTDSFFFRTVTAPAVPGEVAANNHLVTITFDTTGLTAGLWSLGFSGTRAGDSVFGINSDPYIVDPVIINGTIAIPEPGTVSLLLAFAIPVLLRRRAA